MMTRACLAAMVLVSGAMAQDPQKEHKEAMAVLDRKSTRLNSSH